MQILAIEKNNVNEFEKIIKEMPALVKIFSPNCGHCIEMAPAWEELKKNAELKKLPFALVAINANAVSEMTSPGVKNFNGVPTIREIKQGSGEAGKEYNGNRTTEDMAKFIKNSFSSSTNRRTTKSKRGGNCGCDKQGGGKSKKRNKSKSKKRNKSKSKKRKSKSKSSWKN